MQKLKMLMTQAVVDLIANKNIVSIFPRKVRKRTRALGNRSSYYMIPRDLEGKDPVNTVKRREYFRSFCWYYFRRRHA